MPSAAGPKHKANADVAGSRRRGRPTAARAASIQGTILAAARDCFVTSGYEAATMEGVAENAKISKGTLYGRYPDKESLFRAVLRDSLDRWSALSEAQNPELPADLGLRLRAHARVLRMMLEWPDYIEITRLIQDAAAAGFSEFSGFWHEVGTKRYIDFLAKDIAAAAAGLAAPHVNWAFLANLFLFGFTGWYQVVSANRSIDESEVSQFVDRIIESILTLIAHDPPAPTDFSSQMDGHR